MDQHFNRSHFLPTATGAGPVFADTDQGAKPCSKRKRNCWLPTPHSLLRRAFTRVPAELRGPGPKSLTDIYNLLFPALRRSSSVTGSRPNVRGAVWAWWAVLHTCTRQLLYHPQCITYIVTGVGLTADVRLALFPHRLSLPHSPPPSSAPSSSNQLKKSALFAAVALRLCAKTGSWHSEPVGSGSNFQYLAPYILRGGPSVTTPAQFGNGHHVRCTKSRAATDQLK